MIVYKFKNELFGASNLVDNPDQLRYDIENENLANLAEPEYEQIDINEAIYEINGLSIGDVWENQHLSVECMEMTEQEFDKLSEYCGW